LKLQVKSRWVAALRGGQFEQTERALKNADGYCCLGVLCALHAEETGNKWRELVKDNHPCLYLEESDYLPEEVQAWAGLLERDPSIDYEMEESWAGSLSDLNDNGIPFEKIADIIEAQL
jgi:hypothetical protein